MMKQWNKERNGVDKVQPDEVKVVINGHRYNLS